MYISVSFLSHTHFFGVAEYSVTDTQDTKGRRDSADEK